MQKVATHVDVVAICLSGPQGNGLMMHVSWMPGISFTLVLLGPDHDSNFSK